MNHPGYTPNPSIDHEYGQSAHITGHIVSFYVAGPESLEKADIEALEDDFAETFGEMGCKIERVKLTEQFLERTK